MPRVRWLPYLFARQRCLARKRTSSRLTVEALEDRCCPSIALVQPIGTVASTIGTASISVSSPVTAGDTIIVEMVTSDSTTTVRDSVGNVYTKDVSIQPRVAVDAIFSASNVTAIPAGGTITVASRVIFAASAQEFSGLATTNALDQIQSADTGSVTNPSTGFTSTTQQPNELLIGDFFEENSPLPAFTPGASYASLPAATLPFDVINPEYQIVSAIGSYQADATLNVAPSRSLAVLATYIGAVQPVPPSTTPPSPSPSPPPTTDGGPNTLAITVLQADAAAQNPPPPPQPSTAASSSNNAVVVVVMLPPTVISQGVVSNPVLTFSGLVGFQAPATNAPEKNAASVSAHGFDSLEVDTVLAGELDQILRMEMGSYAVKFEHDVLSGVSIVRSLLTGTTPRTDLLAQGADVTPVAALLLRTRANLPAGAGPTDTRANPASFLINPVPADTPPSPSSDGTKDGPRSETPTSKTSPTSLVWKGITTLLGVGMGALHLASRLHMVKSKTTR